MFILCVKSSHAMGMGHLFRAINLYRALGRNGADAVVVLLGEHRPSIEWLRNEDVRFEMIPDSVVGAPDWEATVTKRYRASMWINDRLHTDAPHSARIKALGLKLVTFDDLGDGARLSDLQVAALAGVRGESPQGTKVLVGLEYLVLAPEISSYRRTRTTCNSMVISLGGSDTHGVTISAANWAGKINIPATIVLGPGFAHEAGLAGLDNSRFTVKRAVPSLAAEFFEHDIAITGGGLTAFEAAAAGLPTVTVANIHFEVQHCLHLQKCRCSVFAGSHDAVNWDKLELPGNLGEMSQAALAAVDTEGVTRVCHEVLKLSQAAYR